MQTAMFLWRTQIMKIKGKISNICNVVNINKTLLTRNALNKYFDSHDYSHVPIVSYFDDEEIEKIENINDMQIGTAEITLGKNNDMKFIGEIPDDTDLKSPNNKFIVPAMIVVDDDGVKETFYISIVDKIESFYLTLRDSSAYDKKPNYKIVQE